METESSLPPTRPLALDHQHPLVESARRGDPSAHRALYDAHVERVYRLTYRLSGREDMARDLTQDTLRAFASLDGYRGDCAFGTWLHTIAVSVTLNELKRRKRQQAREAPLDDDAALDALMQIARTHPDRRMRGKALFWLAQKKDDRVMKLISDLLTR